MKFKNILVVSMTAAALAAAGCGSSAPAETTAAATEAPAETTAEETTAEETTAEETEADLETQQKEFRDAHEFYAPTGFPDDTTGKWVMTLTTVTQATNDYAVDYAKLFMQDAEMTDVHWIVNIIYKTTTMLRINPGNILEVHNTEWTEKEELSAKTIGSGLDLGTKFFNLETGEEVTVEADPEAGTADTDEFLKLVKSKAHDNSTIGAEITDVTLEDGTLTIKEDLSGVDPSPFEMRDIALADITSVTDAVLDLDDSCYNAWDQIVMDFGEYGKATLPKSLVKDSGYGKYFDFSDDVLK